MKKKITALVLSAALSLTLLAGCSVSEPSQSSSESSSEIAAVINPLTGEDGFSESAVGKRPVAVMVSNIKQSLPQWGITDADITTDGF